LGEESPSLAQGLSRVGGHQRKPPWAVTDPSIGGAPYRVIGAAKALLTCLLANVGAYGSIRTWADVIPDGFFTARLEKHLAKCWRSAHISMTDAECGSEDCFQLRETFRFRS
jgi:hypothetical protein